GLAERRSSTQVRRRATPARPAGHTSLGWGGDHPVGCRQEGAAPPGLDRAAAVGGRPARRLLDQRATCAACARTGGAEPARLPPPGAIGGRSLLRRGARALSLRDGAVVVPRRCN